jgi:iron(III) transport system permease protein
LLDRGEAAALGLVLVVIALALIGLETLAVRGLPRPSARPARLATRHALGLLTRPALFFVAAVLLLTLFAPVATIVSWAVRGLRSGRSLDLALGATTTSIALALAAAALAVVAAAPIAWWSARGDTSGRIVERLAWIGHALPGLVLALGLVFLAIRVAPALYQSLPLLVAAYAIRFLPEAIGPLRAGLARIPPALGEAARALGRRPLEVARGIVLPLAAPGALAGAGLVALTTLKELPATRVLRPIGVETLATRVWRATSEGLWAQAALPALALLVVAAPITWYLALRPLLDERVGIALGPTDAIPAASVPVIVFEEAT